MLSRQVLFSTVLILAVAAGALGFALYQEKQKESGVEVSVGQNGLSIEQK